MAGGRRALLCAPRLFILGQVQRAQGRLDAAARTYRQALEIGAPPGRPALLAAGIGYAGLAEVTYQRNELDAALRYVTEAIARGRQLAHTQPLAASLVTPGVDPAGHGDKMGAREAMDEAERMAPSPSVAELFNPGPGAAGAASAGPGRCRCGRPLGAGARPQRS
jgi:LuxR family maltose regulon positive regulatory protein